MKTTLHHFGIRSTLLALLCAMATHNATAQLDCSDLSVEHLYYAAFTDTAMELNVQNASGTQIDYPWFSVVDNSGDTIARSVGAFFVLPTGSVLNHVPLVGGMSLPASPLTGTVLLHYAAFPGDSTCAFPVTNLELCPPEPCEEVVLYVYQLDTVGDPWLAWTLRDSANTIVATGDMTPMIGDPASSMDTLCLPPGHYELEIEQSPFAEPGVFAATLMRWLYDLDGPNVQFTSNGLLPFTFFPGCVDGTNAIEEAASHPLLWSLSGSTLSISDPTGQALGTVVLLDARGTLITQRFAGSNATSFDLSNHAPGMYIIGAHNGSTRFAQRFIKN